MLFFLHFQAKKEEEYFYVAFICISVVNRICIILWSMNSLVNILIKSINLWEWHENELYVVFCLTESYFCFFSKFLTILFATYANRYQPPPGHQAISHQPPASEFSSFYLHSNFLRFPFAFRFSPFGIRHSVLGIQSHIIFFFLFYVFHYIISFSYSTFDQTKWYIALSKSRFVG